MVPPDTGTGRLPGNTKAGAGYGRFRRTIACVALVAAGSAPLLVAGYWVKGGVQGPVGSVTSPLLPAFVAASSTSSEQYRTLILRPNGNMLDYDVVRQGDPTLGEPELTPAAAATQALSRQVAALGAPDGADAGDPGLVLGSFGIRWVLLPGPIDPALAQRLDAAVGLVLLSTSSSYDLWQVAGPVGRIQVVAPDGTVTVLASGPLGMSGVSAPAAGGTLVLAEPYGGWTATLNGRALRPSTTPVDGWAQGFALPPGGGQLSISRNNLARAASLLAELVVLLAVCVLALPGKRADPAEAADALAALREARDAKRGARGQLRSGRAATEVAAADGADTAVPAAGTSGRRGRTRRPGVAVAGLGGATRLAMARRRGRGQEADDDEFGAGELPETVPVAEWPAGEAASGPGVAGLADRDFPDDGDEGRAPGDQRQSEHGDGDHGRGGHGRTEERAPWDMAGDWGSGGQRPDPDPWGDDAWGVSVRPGAAEQRDAVGQRDAAEQWSQTDQTEQWGRPGRRNLTGPHATVSRGTGQQPVMPREAPDRPADPWDNGPRAPVSPGSRTAAPWRTGPQQPVSGSGPQRSAPWPSGPQAPLSATDPEPVVRPWDAGNLGAPMGWNHDTGEWEVVTQPAEPAHPAEPAYADEPAYLDEPAYPVEADYPGQRETGSGPWPASTGADRSEAAKPERHSHRASKHGKPSRWRGSTDRSGSGGES